MYVCWHNVYLSLYIYIHINLAQNSEVCFGAPDEHHAKGWWLRYDRNCLQHLGVCQQSYVPGWPNYDLKITSGLYIALVLFCMVLYIRSTMDTLSSWPYRSRRSIWSPLGDISVKSVAAGNVPRLHHMYAETKVVSESYIVQVYWSCWWRDGATHLESVIFWQCIFIYESPKEMVSRMALILWVLEAKKCFWLYEQPQTSLLWEHPRMQGFLKSNLVYKTHMWMGSYGGLSPKGTHLWAPCEQVSKFSLPLPQKEWDHQLVAKKVLPDGSVQVTGNGALKQSQAYPKQFGKATVCVWLNTPCRTFSTNYEKASTKKIPSFWKGNMDKWADANLSDVMQFLSLGTLK